MLCYTTKNGEAYCGDSLQLLQSLDDDSVDLFFVSPPFPLTVPKEYGNEAIEDYVEWLMQFVRTLLPKLKEKGSLVIDLGSIYTKGRPVYHLYQYKLVIRLCEELDLRLCQQFYWQNINALPSPIQWVSRAKIRAKNAIDMVFWLSKSDYPKADVTKVLVPYSKQMKKMLKHPRKFFKKNTKHPSGYTMHDTWKKNNGGAIPSNLLSISNSESRSQYLSLCRALKVRIHPARFPYKLPEFFIKFLTDEQDLVVDFFAGSNTTGMSAEQHNRRWKSFELDLQYVAASSFRFLSTRDEEKARICYKAIMDGQTPVDLSTD